MTSEGSDTFLCFIVQNAMRAVVETHMEKDKELPALNLKICKGVEDLTIKVLFCLLDRHTVKIRKFRHTNNVITVMILSFRTDRPGQTVQTQIRMLL